MTPLWTIYLTVLSFVIGACVGSFLNVCVHRIPREESVISPRSRCPHCVQKIAWYDNIPLVSFIVLRARCRQCGGVISPRYFIVELLTSVLFLVAWNRYGLDVRTPIYWMVISGLILGTFVDLSHMIIPDRVSLGGMVAGIVCSALFPILHGKDSVLDAVLASLLGLAAGSGLLLVVLYGGKMILKRDAMGFGDVKLLGAIGAFLGWQAVLFTVMASSVLGSAVGLYFVASRKKEWQSRIPYGPYLAVAAVAWILGGSEWWQAYVRWLSGGGWTG